MEVLYIGQQINIQRSNGLVHGVIISKLQNDCQIVNVEWTEGGEVKGKEVTLESIIAFNPKIFKRSLPSRLDSKTYMSLKPKFYSNSARNSVALKTAMVDEALPKTNKSIPCSSNAPAKMPHSSEAFKAAKPAVRRTHISRPTTTMESRRAAGGAHHEKNTPVKTVTRRHIETKRASSLGSKRCEDDSKMPPTISTSCVVKRINEMKENREKQREKNALARQARKELKSKDPENPNWEITHMLRKHRSTIEYFPLLNIGDIEPVSQQITVCVRKRPLNRKERDKYEQDVVSVIRKDIVMVHEPRHKVDLTKFLEHHSFCFDYVFDESCDNEMIYHYTAKPLVDTIFSGGNATCFAYGQTGSGKTHTMGGVFDGKDQITESGIYALVAKDVFEALNSLTDNSMNLFVSCSFFEIYGGKVFDLLTDEKKLLRVLEDGKQQVQVVGLKEMLVTSVQDVLQFIETGSTIRTSGTTSANSNSSRSHAVFQIVLRSQGVQEPIGKFSIVDLAGNERGADTFTASRQTRLEGAEINKSLLALKECIRAMAHQSAHLPFRGSTLTQVLRDSFIGGQKNKTCMIAMISPGLNSCEHTLNTLRYADRVKEMAVPDRSLSNVGYNDRDTNDVNDKMCHKNSEEQYFSQ